MELDDFRLVVDVHLMGAVNCTKAVWETMRAQNYGRIVMTTSSSGLYGNFGQANYGAAEDGAGRPDADALDRGREERHPRQLPGADGGDADDREAHARGGAASMLESGAVTPGLLALVADDAPTRAILCAGAGSFERAHVTLTQGIHVGTARRRRRADRRCSFDAISDRTDETVPESGAAQGTLEIGKAMQANAEGSGAARQPPRSRPRGSAEHDRFQTPPVLEVRGVGVGSEPQISFRCWSRPQPSRYEW